MAATAIPHLFARAPELIEEARNGRMFILVDDCRPDNEGDLVIPAQMATPTAINFMATHGRGLIRLALTRRRTESLGLGAIGGRGGDGRQSAFTATIEAKEGVTTGISAGDRARTIAVAVDAARGAADIVTPGHVFPLIASDGGVLARPGRAEAAVDLARLAGLNESGVLCEIMRDDGMMAQLADLAEFAGRHDLKIGSVRDLIDFRRRHDRCVERRSTVPFISRWGGPWSAVSYANSATGAEVLALVKAGLDPSRPVPVRLCAVSLLDDLLGASHAVSLRHAMRATAKGDGGVILLTGLPAIAAALPDPGDCAQILTDLGVQDIVVPAGTDHFASALQRYGLAAAAAAMPAGRDRERPVAPVLTASAPERLIA